MGKTQFQYDETGTTYYYVFLTFLGLILIPSTYYFWPFQKEPEIDPEKKKKYMAAAAKGTVYAQACDEKAERLQQKGIFNQIIKRRVSPQKRHKSKNTAML